MTITIKETELPEVLEIESPIFEDDRGYFTEIYNEQRWREAGFDRSFVQDNLSFSSLGTLRGLHYQLNPDAQGKLVRTIRGSVFDVAVDIREDSPTFGQWIGRTLTEKNGIALWIPVGFAHGFIALENDTQVLYKCTHIYTPEAERSLAYNDPQIDIEWPIEPVGLKEQDAQAPTLDTAQRNFTYP